MVWNHGILWLYIGNGIIIPTDEVIFFRGVEHIFQRGWNHQPVIMGLWIIHGISRDFNLWKMGFHGISWDYLGKFCCDLTAPEAWKDNEWSNVPTYIHLYFVPNIYSTQDISCSYYTDNIYIYTYIYIYHIIYIIIIYYNIYCKYPQRFFLHTISRSPPTEIHSLKADGWKDISTRGPETEHVRTWWTERSGMDCLYFHDIPRIFPWIPMTSPSNSLTAWWFGTWILFFPSYWEE